MQYHKSALLIVDDEKPTRDGLQLAFGEQYECYLAASIQQAQRVLKNQAIDIVLTDLRLGQESGLEVLKLSLELQPTVPVIVMTAYGSVDSAVKAMQAGAWNFLTKPLRLDEVEVLLKKVIASRQIQQKNIALKAENKLLAKQIKQYQQADNFIGNSQVMQQLLANIRQVANTQATILIEGESGTGKELVAKLLHQYSDRSAQNMVTVNCAALASQLLESELFGHEKGAFTGALQQRIGRFEQANQSSLFLDEIGDIDAATQVKLLRVLSEHTIERVGSNKPIKINTRVITASHKNLWQLVNAGEFREDLYYRLNVIHLQVPPLRDRKEDIAQLSHHFVAEFAKKNQRHIEQLSTEVCDVFLQYDWPGNVRELRSVLEHAVIMSSSEIIELQHLPPSLLAKQNKASFSQSLPCKSDDHFSPKGDFFSKFNLYKNEINLIKDALQAAEGNKTQAAEYLGISRRTLHRKIKQWHL